MTEFILNNEHIITELPSGSVLLDFIRNENNLTGTKIGCREGDCGACTVLIGTLCENDEIKYSSVTSCLTPLGSVHKKHVITIEGLNLQQGLTPIQSAFKKNNATQCGFCTSGFIVSLTGYALNEKTTITGIKDSISGNVCRCTGYTSISMASEQISEMLVKEYTDSNISKLIYSKILPEYFEYIPSRLKKIKSKEHSINEGTIIGGGTDLYVTEADELEDSNISFINARIGNKISVTNTECTIGAGATASDIMYDKELQKLFPQIVENFKLISSEQIRNMGTIGGNLVNASPIADLVIFFLALNARINIKDSKSIERNIPLKDFYRGYKDVDLNENEILVSLSFKLPGKNDIFSFEKVSKRKHLDIASVNSALLININNSVINSIHISAGGIAPVPLFLKNTCAFLKGKKLTPEIIRKAHCVLKQEISPIADIRGSIEYKRLLMRQLFFTHFIKSFPDFITINDLK